MADSPLLQQVMGDKFEQLTGPVRNHFSLTAGDKARIVLQGQMDEIWHPGWLTLPMWLSSFLGVLFPERGRNVPTYITIEAHNLRQQWHRTFDFGRRRRTFSDAMVYEPAEKRILNFFGSRDQFAMIFHFRPLPNGGLEIIGGQQYLILGQKRLPVPRLFTPAIIVQEWPVGPDTIEMEFKMHHPAVGRLYKYSGRFSVKKEVYEH